MEIIELYLYDGYVGCCDAYLIEIRVDDDVYELEIDGKSFGKFDEYEEVEEYIDAYKLQNHLRYFPKTKKEACGYD